MRHGKSVTTPTAGRMVAACLLLVETSLLDGTERCVPAVDPRGAQMFFMNVSFWVKGSV